MLGESNSISAASLFCLLGSDVVVAVVVVVVAAAAAAATATFYSLSSARTRSFKLDLATNTRPISKVPVMMLSWLPNRVGTRVTRNRRSYKYFVQKLFIEVY